MIYAQAGLVMLVACYKNAVLIVRFAYRNDSMVPPAQPAAIEVPMMLPGLS